MRICPKCSFEFNDDFKFCPKCGNQYVEAVVGDLDNLDYSGSAFNYNESSINNQQNNNMAASSRNERSVNNGINYGRSNEQTVRNYPVQNNQVTRSQYNNTQYNYSQPKRKSGSMMPLIITLAVVLFLGVGVSSLFSGSSSDNETSKSSYDDISETTSVKETEINTSTEDKTETRSVVEEKKNNYPTLSTGVYIVGEDIDEGTYCFHVVSGLGELLLYESYDEYKADDYGYDSLVSFDLKAHDASSGLTNEDVYAEYVSGIVLEKDQCLSIKKGAVVEYASSLEDYGVNGVITPGIYVVGSNLASGKYTFNAISGMGEVLVYSSYDEFKKASSSYDADESYDIKAPGASVGLTNEDIYSNSINNIRLDDGQCLCVRKGLTLSYTDNYTLSDNNTESSDANAGERSIDESSTEATVDTEEENNDSSSSSSGYEAIYNEYAKKIRDATPKLVEEYKKEAASNTKGLEGLATISNKKVEKLAEIMNEGISEMADYMMKKGSGKYEDYSDWSGKLWDVYMEEADKIMDAYMDSAM